MPPPGVPDWVFPGSSLTSDRLQGIWRIQAVQEHAEGDLHVRLIPAGGRGPVRNDSAGWFPLDWVLSHTSPTVQHQLRVEASDLASSAEHGEINILPETQGWLLVQSLVRYTLRWGSVRLEPGQEVQVYCPDWDRGTVVQTDTNDMMVSIDGGPAQTFRVREIVIDEGLRLVLEQLPEDRPFRLVHPGEVYWWGADDTIEQIEIDALDRVRLHVTFRRASGELQTVPLQEFFSNLHEGALMLGGDAHDMQARMGPLEEVTSTRRKTVFEHILEAIDEE